MGKGGDTRLLEAPSRIPRQWDPSHTKHILTKTSRIGRVSILTMNLCAPRRCVLVRHPCHCTRSHRST